MEMYANINEEDKFQIIENKLTEMRKLSFGTLLLAKEIWKDKLKEKPEWSEVLKAIKEAEESFIDSSLTDKLEIFDNIIKGLFLLLEDMLREQHKTT